MQDFLEYMGTLGVLHNTAATRSVQQMLNTMSRLVAQLHNTRHPQEIAQYAQTHLLLNHPWLLSFQQAKVSPAVMETWLQQRYLISWSFPNWFAGVTAKLPTAASRLPMLVNLCEEHGLMGGQLHSKPHPEMWRQLFEELQAIAPGEALPLPTLPADLTWGTRLYLIGYTEGCFYSSSLLGLGMMAFTESILPYENRRILLGLKRMGVSEAGREFFAVHCECDENHAHEIFEVILQLASEPALLQQVWQGVAVAAIARKSFYDALLTLNNQSCIPIRTTHQAKSILAMMQ